MIPGRQLLEEEPEPDEFESYQLGRNFYKSCMDEEIREELGIQPLIDLVSISHINFSEKLEPVSLLISICFWLKLM